MSLRKKGYGEQKGGTKFPLFCMPRAREGAGFFGGADLGFFARNT